MTPVGRTSAFPASVGAPLTPPTVVFCASVRVSTVQRKLEKSLTKSSTSLSVPLPHSLVLVPCSSPRTSQISPTPSTTPLVQAPMSASETRTIRRSSSNALAQCQATNSIATIYSIYQAFQSNLFVFIVCIIFAPNPLFSFRYHHKYLSLLRRLNNNENTLILQKI